MARGTPLRLESGGGFERKLRSIIRGYLIGDGFTAEELSLGRREECPPSGVNNSHQQHLSRLLATDALSYVRFMLVL